MSFFIHAHANEHSFFFLSIAMSLFARMFGERHQQQEMEYLFGGWMDGNGVANFQCRRLACFMIMVYVHEILIKKV